MDIRNIGTNIAALRKEKGITQEALAKNVGVSPQAVSKWENGGVPDTELLPVIADFFDTSIDRLFGRSDSVHVNINDLIIQTLINTDRKDRFQSAFDLCWEIERALPGEWPDENGLPMREYVANAPQTEHIYSGMTFDEGFSCMKLSNQLQYFLLVPESEHVETALLEGINYPDFFSALSDPDVFHALLYLNQRENGNSFTTKLLINSLNITEEKAIHIINILKKYRLLHCSTLELDDTVQEIYRFYPTSSFFALLIFAREMIEKPCHFYCSWQHRKKPFFK